MGSTKIERWDWRRILSAVIGVQLSRELQSPSKLLAHHRFLTKSSISSKHTLDFDGFTFPAPEHAEFDHPKVGLASKAQAQYPTAFRFCFQPRFVT